MQFVNIASAAALTGIGLGAMAASAVMWRRAGFDPAVIARAIAAIGAQSPAGAFTHPH